MAEELWSLSARELIALYTRREVSPVEVTNAVFDRIELVNPKLEAFWELNRDDALASASRGETAWRGPGYKPPLCGIPVSVKDTIEVGGMPTTYGSLAFRDNMQPDSEIARRLRLSGAVITGKTGTPEFAMGGFVTTRLHPHGRNAWDLDRTCGGSSGGASAAVAAGLGPIAIGTDSGGSIRDPAGYNGVFGYKPTFQRIPAVQAWRASPTRSVNGPITRTVSDAWLALHALAGPHRYDRNSMRFGPVGPPITESPLRLSGYSVGLITEVHGISASSLKIIHNAMTEIVEVIAELGVRVDDEPIDFPEFTGGNAALGVAEGEKTWPYCGDQVAAAESLISGFLAKHRDDLTDYARAGFDWGEKMPAYRYRNFLKAIDRYVGEMHDAIDDFDFVITPLLDVAPLAEDAPTVPLPHPHVGCFNYSHHPAAAVPIGFDENGLPLAIQIVARIGADEDLLMLCAAVEAARPWQENWPDLG